MTSLVYQVDCNVRNTGKTVAVTKRRVTWKFGVANPSALAEGKTGVECRGHEHEIKLIWSITSGKRSVVFDGQEVHFSQGKPLRENKFCFQWSEWGHSFYMIAHVAPPIPKSTDFKMFDLLIDGQSFAVYPKIYQLGQEVRSVLKRSSGYHVSQGADAHVTMQPSSSSHFGVPARNAPPQYEYRNDYYNVDSNQFSASPRQDSSPRNLVSRKGIAIRAPESSVVKIDLLGDEAAQPGGSSAVVPDLLDMISSSINTSVCSTLLHDEFQPKSNSYEDISANILKSYTSHDCETIPFSQNHNSHHQQVSTLAPALSRDTESQPTPEPYSLIPVQHNFQATRNPFDFGHSYTFHEVENNMSTLRVDTNSPSCDDDMVSNFSAYSPTCVSDVDMTLKKICNLDDISQAVLKPYKVQPVMKEHNSNLPLSQLKMRSSGVPKKEVMRNQHIYQPSDGQHLVVYGQSPKMMGGQSFHSHSLNYSYSN